MICPVASDKFANQICAWSGFPKGECEHNSGHLHCRCCGRALNHETSKAMHLCFFCRTPGGKNQERFDTWGNAIGTHVAHPLAPTARSLWSTPA